MDFYFEDFPEELKEEIKILYSLGVSIEEIEYLIKIKSQNQKLKN